MRNVEREKKLTKMGREKKTHNNDFNLSSLIWSLTSSPLDTNFAI